MSQWYRNRIVIFFSVIVSIFVATGFYLTSDHHAYNVAVEHYRGKEYKHALSVLDRLAPKYQQSAKGNYLRNICLYNLALGSFDRKCYVESLDYMKPIHETFQEYDDVMALRQKIEEIERQIAEEKERERQIAEEGEWQKLIAEQKKREEEERKKEQKEERKIKRREEYRNRPKTKAEKRRDIIWNNKMDALRRKLDEL